MRTQPKKQSLLMVLSTIYLIYIVSFCFISLCFTDMSNSEAFAFIFPSIWTRICKQLCSFNELGDSVLIIMGFMNILCFYGCFHIFAGNAFYPWRHPNTKHKVPNRWIVHYCFAGVIIDLLTLLVVKFFSFPVIELDPCYPTVIGDSLAILYFVIWYQANPKHLGSIKSKE